MRNYFLLIIIFIFLSACTQSTGVGRNSAEEIQRSLSDLRSIQAEITAQQSQIQDEVRQLVGRVEELEFKVRGRPTGVQPTVGVMPPQPMLPPTANNQQTQPAPIFRPPTQQQVTQPQVPSALTTYDTPPPIVPINELARDEEQARHLDVSFSRTLTDALYFIRRGEFRQALQFLAEVTNAASGKDGHAQALFWQGVANDGIGNNREALVAYNSVIAQYPNTDRARLSLLRLASVFIRLGDTATAKITLQKLIAESPGTKEAEQARSKLSDLG